MGFNNNHTFSVDIRPFLLKEYRSPVSVKKAECFLKTGRDYYFPAKVTPTPQVFFRLHLKPFSITTHHLKLRVNNIFTLLINGSPQSVLSHQSYTPIIKRHCFIITAFNNRLPAFIYKTPFPFSIPNCGFTPRKRHCPGKNRFYYRFSFFIDISITKFPFFTDRIECHIFMISLHTFCIPKCKFQLSLLINGTRCFSRTNDKSHSFTKNRCLCINSRQNKFSGIVDKPDTSTTPGRLYQSNILTEKRNRRI